MKLTPLDQMSQELVHFCREKFKLHISQAVFELMKSHGLSRVELAQLLGVNKSRVTRILSGDQNLGLETLSDIFLCLQRSPFINLGSDVHETRLPVIERDTPVGVQVFILGDGQLVTEELANEDLVKGAQPIPIRKYLDTMPNAFNQTSLNIGVGA